MVMAYIPQQVRVTVSKADPRRQKAASVLKAWSLPLLFLKACSKAVQQSWSTRCLQVKRVRQRRGSRVQGGLRLRLETRAQARDHAPAVAAKRFQLLQHLPAARMQEARLEVRVACRPAARVQRAARARVEAAVQQ